MTIRMEEIGKGIVRLRRSERFEESLLERYGVIDARETGAAGFSADPTGITRENGARIPLRVWTEAEDPEWTARLTDMKAAFAERSAGKRVIIGDPRGLYPEAPADVPAPEYTPFGVEFTVSETARFYGLGEGKRDGLNLRGGRYQNWVYYQFDEAPIPFLMCSEGWGLLINNDFKHFVDVCAERPDKLRILGEYGELDLFFFDADSMQGVLKRYARLTGHSMVLPKWAYGLTYIAPIYANQFEVLNDARTFREKKIPCDMISLEPGWMTKFYDHGLDKDWEITRFHMPTYRRRPHPESFVTALKRYGFHVKLWLCVDYDLTAEAERLAKGEETCAPPAWFDHLIPFVEDGVDAFKLDPCELVYEVHPDLHYVNGKTDMQMHNLNQVLLGKQMYDGFARLKNRRPMHHYCGAYTGMQRFSAFTTGDNGGRQGALIWMLNLGLSGMMNVTCDMDVHSAESIHFGLLLPWGHLNSWYGFSQPWWAGDALEEAFAQYARLRYRLLPYYYSTALEGREEDLPMLRAMPLAFPEFEPGWDMTTQFMLGPWAMVTVFGETVAFPEGEWLDVWTGEVYRGPCEKTYRAPEGRGGGLFVRRGAILPAWRDRDFVGQYPDDALRLHVYPDPTAESAYILREDDGDSLEYETRPACRTRVVCRVENGEALIDIGRRDGEYAGKCAARTWEIVVHDFAGQVRVRLEDAGDRYEMAARDLPL